MSSFDTAVRGALRFKRNSEALVADDKRRKKKKKNKASKDEDAGGPAVADLPPELANDPEAIAAAAAVREGKQQPGVLLNSGSNKSSAGDESPAGVSQDGGAGSVETPDKEVHGKERKENEEDDAEKDADSRSRSGEASRASASRQYLSLFFDPLRVSTCTGLPIPHY